MAQVIFTLSAADLTRGITALSDRWGYPVLVNGVANPQTRGEFVRLKIAAWWKSEVRAHELGTAQAAVTVGADLDIT